TAGKQDAMNAEFRARHKALSGPMRIRVAEQQHKLKKQHAGCPHAGRAAELRQNCFGNDRLDQKQQQRAEKYGRDPDDLHELNRIIRERGWTGEGALQGEWLTVLGGTRRPYAACTVNLTPTLFWRSLFQRQDAN